MVSPGELVKTTSALLGVPEPTVTQHDRNLVVNGLRTKSGRGTSAAKVTPRDASHLLVSIMGSAQVKDSAMTLERYGISQADDEGPDIKYTKLRVPMLAKLLRTHSFLDALEALIASAADGSLMTGTVENGEMPNIEVRVLEPFTVGVISIQPHGKPQRWTNVRYYLPYPNSGTNLERQEKHKELMRKYVPNGNAGLMRDARITTESIVGIAKLFSTQ